MAGLRWVLLLYAHAAAMASKPRSVNLALETTFEFNEKKDMALIKNVRQFLNRIESNVERKLAARERPNETSYPFTEFLRDLISVLNSYEDDDFRGVFKALHHVVSTHRGGGGVNGVIDSSLRPALLDALKRSIETPVRLQKERLSKLSFVLRSADRSHASFVNFLNLLYKGKPASGLRRILRGFRLFRRRTGSENLRELVRDAVEYLVYAHYAGLDASVRRDVGAWLRTLLKEPTAGRSKLGTAKPLARQRLSSAKRASRHTFVTLYPEAIDLNGMTQSAAAPWKEITVPNKNRFYLVKGKRRSWKGTGNGDESSGSSLEIATVRNSSTTASQGRRERPTDTTFNPRKAFAAKPSSRRLGQSHRGVNSSDPSAVTTLANCSDLTSVSYLERIKHLEEQLSEMKSELRAKASANSVGTDTPPIDQYDYPDDKADSKRFATVANNASDETNSTETVEADAVFRTEGNSSSIPLGDSPLSTEIKEFLKKQPRLLDVQRANHSTTVSVTEHEAADKSADEGDTVATTEHGVADKSAEDATTVAGTAAETAHGKQQHNQTPSDTTEATKVVNGTQLTTVASLANNATLYFDPAINLIR
ncbi:unnamed protein product, partial [Iphiclides podalirius]